MRLLICSACGFRAKESEWLCTLQGTKVVNIQCPECIKMLPDKAELTSSEDDDADFYDCD